MPVCNPYAQINLLSGKGKTDRKSRTATARSEFTEATASEINHDLVIVLSVRSLKWAQCMNFVISVTARSENPVWCCLALRLWFCVFVVETYNNLFPHVSLHKDLHTHSTHCMQITLNLAISDSFRTGLWKMFCFQRILQNSNLFTFSGLKWNKLFLDLALLALRRLPLQHFFLSPFPGSCATWLRPYLNSKTLSTAHNGKTNRGRLG